MSIKFEALDIFPSAQPVNSGTYLLYGEGSGASRQDFQLDIDQLYEAFISKYKAEDAYQVGDVFVTFNSEHPYTDRGYGHAASDWELLEGDVNVMTASAGHATRKATGSNSITIPVVHHRHGGTISGHTTSTGAHRHHLSLLKHGGMARGHDDSGFYAWLRRTTRWPISETPDAYTNTDGAHNHNVGGSLTTDYQGVSGSAATRDVKGRHVLAYYWVKVK